MGIARYFFTSWTNASISLTNGNHMLLLEPETALRAMTSLGSVAIAGAHRP